MMLTNNLKKMVGKQFAKSNIVFLDRSVEIHFQDEWCNFEGNIASLNLKGNKANTFPIWSDKILWKYVEGSVEGWNMEYILKKCYFTNNLDNFILPVKCKWIELISKYVSVSKYIPKISCKRLWNFE